MTKNQLSTLINNNSLMQNQQQALKMQALINKKKEQIRANNVSMRPGYYNDQLRGNVWRTLNNY